jgi:penicillin-binding protein 2
MLIRDTKLHGKTIQILVILLLVLVSINADAQSRHSRQKIQTAKEKNQKNKQGKQNNEKRLSKEERRKVLLEARKRQLEEIRRRQEAIRRERERILAFERSLYQETVENILNDDPKGENLEIRRAAINALGNHAGTVVVMETETGRILTIVNQNWAIRKGFKPCSTIKLVTAIAGINESIISENGEIISHPFSLRLTDALAYSNNTYFQRVGYELGNEKFIEYAKMLGLGEPTGINAEGEFAGKLPYSNGNLRVYSHGDDVEVTPLQLAIMVSAITNGGKIVVPQIPENSIQKVVFAVRREINLSKRTLENILPGMVGAVAYGTAKSSDGVYYSVAGKTGSCIGQGSWLGLFASVAPAINPKYTVVVVTRGQKERGRVAAMIAGKIYQALFNQSKDAQMLLAESKKKLSVPKPQIDAKLSLLLDGGSEEADDVFGKNSNRSKTKQKNNVDDLLLDEENTDGDSYNNLKNASSSKTQQSQSAAKKTNDVLKPIIIEVKRTNNSSIKEDETKKSAESKKTDEKDLFTRPRVVKSVINSRIMK